MDMSRSRLLDHPAILRGAKRMAIRRFRRRSGIVGRLPSRQVEHPGLNGSQRPRLG